MSHLARPARRRSTPAGMRIGRRPRRGGFSLVEVLVALALFGVSMSAIAALSFAVTRRSTETAGTVERAVALEARVNDLFSIPWTEIDARAGCTTISAQPFPREECITVTTASGRKTMTLTVTPADASLNPTSVSVERTQPPATNPFRVVK